MLTRGGRCDKLKFPRQYLCTCNLSGSAVTSIEKFPSVNSNGVVLDVRVHIIIIVITGGRQPSFHTILLTVDICFKFSQTEVKTKQIHLDVTTLWVAFGVDERVILLIINAVYIISRFYIPLLTKRNMQSFSLSVICLSIKYI